MFHYIQTIHCLAYHLVAQNIFTISISTWGWHLELILRVPESTFIARANSKTLYMQKQVQILLKAPHFPYIIFRKTCKKLWALNRYSTRIYFLHTFFHSSMSAFNNKSGSYYLKQTYNWYYFNNIHNFGSHKY